MDGQQELLQDLEKKGTYIETPVKTIFKKFANQKDVSLVYGEPIELGLKKIVPAAKVKYAVGGGGDGAGGEGGGGSFSVKPIGVYEITPAYVKFKPAADPGKTALWIVLACGVLGVLTRLKGK